MAVINHSHYLPVRPEIQVGSLKVGVILMIQLIHLGVITITGGMKRLWFARAKLFTMNRNDKSKSGMR